MILIFFVLVGYGDTGSTPNSQNEVEVNMVSNAIPATTMREADVPFVLFGEIKDINYGDVNPMYNGFKGVLKTGDDATIEMLHFMPKHKFRPKVWNSYIIYCLSG